MEPAADITHCPLPTHGSAEATGSGAAAGYMLYVIFANSGTSAMGRGETIPGNNSFLFHVVVQSGLQGVKAKIPFPQFLLNHGRDNPTPLRVAPELPTTYLPTIPPSCSSACRPACSAACLSVHLFPSTYPALRCNPPLPVHLLFFTYCSHPLINHFFCIQPPVSASALGFPTFNPTFIRAVISDEWQRDTASSLFYIVSVV